MSDCAFLYFRGRRLGKYRILLNIMITDSKESKIDKSESV